MEAKSADERLNQRGTAPRTVKNETVKSGSIKSETLTFPLQSYYHHKFDSYKPIKTMRDYKNKFLNTIMESYNKEVPLHIAVEDFQITINNMMAEFVNDEPERYRHIFVNESEAEVKQSGTVYGKKNLHIDMDSLREHVTKDISIWDLTMYKWASMITADVKDQSFIENSACDYSTSTTIDQLVSIATVMSTVKAYYGFSCSTCCGIPKVYLDGTINDWRRFLMKTIALAKFIGNEFDVYISKNIVPIIQKFIETKESEGQINKELIDYWSHIISHTEIYGSGAGIYFSGWIINLFPSIHNQIISVDYKLQFVSPGLTDIPITFNNNGQIIKLSLHAGYQATEQLDDGSVRVIKGYYLAVTDGKKKKGDCDLSNCVED